MTQSPLGDLVVEVLHSRGDDQRADWSVGSGYLVRESLVLTAAHNVGNGELLVRFHGAEEQPATIVKQGVEALVDLALLRVVGSGIPHQVRYGRVDRTSAAIVERCWAVGFPRFNERTRPGLVKPLRQSVQVNGEIPTGQNLGQELLTLRVTSSPRPLPAALGDSEWSGMSGAVVFAGTTVVGVVTEHHLPEGESSLTVVPLTAIDQLASEEAAGWWRLLGVETPEELAWLPRKTARRPPAYLATIAELAPATLLGRENELAELAAFTTGSEGYRWQVGGPWTGKTALAATFVRSCPPNVDVVAYFLLRRRSDADCGRFLRVVNDQLAYLLDEKLERRNEPVPDPFRNESDLFRDLWIRAGQQAEQRGRHLLLLVDGLDEDLGPSAGNPSVAQLLPLRAGGHVHVLVSSRRYPEIPGDVPPGHPLHRVRQVELSPSSLAARLELRARQDLDHWLGRRDADRLAGEVFGLLAAAQGPLSVDDLAAMAAPDETGVRARVLHLVEQDVARVLEPVGPSGTKRFVFAHDSLREEAQRVLGTVDLERYGGRILGYIERLTTHIERLTIEAAPELARVRCLPDSDIGFGVRVLVVPRVESDGMFPFEELVPSDETLTRVVAYLDAHRAVGTRVFIEPPVYQGFTVMAHVRSRHARPQEVRDRALAALYAYFHPVIGGPDHSGWPFGRPLRRGDVYASLQIVPGIEAVEDVRLFPTDPISGDRGDAADPLELFPDALLFSYEHEVIVTTP